ncbi:MAG: hypothetical protein ACTTKQ_06880 [Filifactor alocis]|uniref:hypothetical protein n=1 Tax=Filifactor alocis TaxID=143361 RepID=UPI003F9F0CC7
MTRIEMLYEKANIIRGLQEELLYRGRYIITEKNNGFYELKNTSFKWINENAISKTWSLIAEKSTIDWTVDSNESIEESIINDLSNKEFDEIIQELDLVINSLKYDSVNFSKKCKEFDKEVEISIQKEIEQRMLSMSKNIECHDKQELKDDILPNMKLKL